MDLNSNQPAPINTLDSSIISVTSSFSQLEMNASTGEPINFLPNKMMLLILAKLNLDFDVKKLLPLRLVSTRWRSLVEDYCKLKKSLSVVLELNTDKDEKLFYAKDFGAVDHKEHVKERFFGFGNSNDFVRLELIPRVPSRLQLRHLRSLLINTFPNIVQLSFHYEGPDAKALPSNNAIQILVPDLTEYIKSLDSLKQLDLDEAFVWTMSSLSSTLSQLEHFSIYSHFVIKPFLDYDDHDLIVSQLSPTCVRVKFLYHLRFIDYSIRHWHDANPEWVANLTHLQIGFQSKSADFGPVVQSLCERATSLKHLAFNPRAEKYSEDYLDLTPTVIEDLAKLTHLTELKLWNTRVDMSKLSDAASQCRLRSLCSVLSCELVLYSQHFTTGDLCTRVLSIIFSNLVNLVLVIHDSTKAIQKKAQIEQHLGRFVNLRKHEIEVMK